MIQQLVLATFVASMPINTRIDFDQGAVTSTVVREFEEYLERPESESASATRPRTLPTVKTEEDPWIGDFIDTLIEGIPVVAWESVPTDLANSIDRKLYGKD